MSVMASTRDRGCTPKEANDVHVQRFDADYDACR
jgi:hypothetical protein